MLNINIFHFPGNWGWESNRTGRKSWMGENWLCSLIILTLIMLIMLIICRLIMLFGNVWQKNKYFVTHNVLQNVHSYFNWPSLNAPWEQLMEIGQMWRMGKLGKTGQTVQKWAATITRKKMGLGRRGEIYYKRRFRGLAKISLQYVSVCH